MSCRGMVHDLHMDADSASLTSKALNIRPQNNRDNLFHDHIPCMHEQPVDGLALMV